MNWLKLWIKLAIVWDFGLLHSSAPFFYIPLFFLGHVSFLRGSGANYRLLLFAHMFCLIFCNPVLQDSEEHAHNILLGKKITKDNLYLKEKRSRLLLNRSRKEFVAILICLWWLIFTVTWPTSSRIIWDVSHSHVDDCGQCVDYINWHGKTESTVGSTIP